MTDRQISNFKKKIIVKQNCWEWAGAKNDRGYGRFGVDGKNERAHRVSYSHFIGKIPRGKLVCHACDNPPCCNPFHLFLGTPKKNVIDMIKKGRAKHRYLYGLDHPKTKLNRNFYDKILLLRSRGFVYRQISEKLGISISIAHSVVKGRRDHFWSKKC